jgi:MFS family permease
MESIKRSDVEFVAESVPVNESTSSGVSWSAVIGGAFVAAAMGFTLMALGAGMGLSSVSPWPHATSTATKVGVGAIVWIIIVQLLACALGGYVAGRLRTKWVSVHTHEVFFRDTAHGLLVWAVGVVITAAFLSSLASALARDLSGTSSEGTARPGDYFADSLFRTDHPTPETLDASVRSEAKAILARSAAESTTLPGDRDYLASLVAARTGLAAQEAQTRVDETIAAERKAIDDARKAVAHSLYWLVVALLVGAFAGSCAAVIGGRRRDYVWA